MFCSKTFKVGYAVQSFAVDLFKLTTYRQDELKYGEISSFYLADHIGMVTTGVS